MNIRGVAAILLLLTCALPAARAEVVVITSPDRASVELDRTLLRALFTMRLRQWPDGTPARVFVLSDRDSIHERFCRDVLGTFPYVLRNTWDRAVFTGTGYEPERVSTQAEMIEKVRSSKGAIGYVDEQRGSWRIPMLADVRDGEQR